MSSHRSSVGFDCLPPVHASSPSNVYQSGSFQDTISHIQTNLRLLTAQHDGEVTALRAENRRLRTYTARPGQSRFASDVAMGSAFAKVPYSVQAKDAGSLHFEVMVKDRQAAYAMPNSYTCCWSGTERAAPSTGSVVTSAALHLPCNRNALHEDPEGHGALETSRDRPRSTRRTSADAGTAGNAYGNAGEPKCTKLDESVRSGAKEDKRVEELQGALPAGSPNQHMPSGRSTMVSQKSSLPVEEGRLSRIVKSKAFEAVFSLIIVLNCVTMGLEAEYLVRKASASIEIALEVSEHIFTFLFTGELLLRIRVFGWRTFMPTSSANMFNFLDAMLVLTTGILFGWVWPLISRIIGTTGGDGAIRIFTVLRAFRLMRLARVVRKVDLFHEAWLLIRGLSNSVRTLFWTAVVIFALAYIFAVFGLALVSQDLVHKYRAAPAGTTEREDLELLVEYVGSMAALIFTLIQLLTTDNWSDVVRLAVKHNPWSVVYFYCYIGVVVIVLMNLVTAIIVENALTTSKMDEDKQLSAKERTKHQELKKLQSIFLMMDKDGDGTLSWEEFEAAFQEEEIRKKWKLLDFQPDECKELFDLLDRGDGLIQIEDFYDGLTRIKGTAQSKDVFQLMKNVERLTHAVRGTDLVRAGSQLSDLGNSAQRKAAA